MYTTRVYCTLLDCGLCFFVTSLGPSAQDVFVQLIIGFQTHHALLQVYWSNLVIWKTVNCRAGSSLIDNLIPTPTLHKKYGKKTRGQIVKGRIMCLLKLALKIRSLVSQFSAISGNQIILLPLSHHHFLDWHPFSNR